MRYYFPQYFTQKSRFLSYHVIYAALVNAGHECVNVLAHADAAIFAICDVTEYRELVKLYQYCGEKPLIVGGAFAFNFWSAKLYSSAVWVGEVFDFAKCQTLKDVYDSPFCYTGGDSLPMASQRIEWDAVPVARINPKMCYYWGGVGCKNKCLFCYTSWTHKHQSNSKGNISAARMVAKRKKLHLMISSNEYENDPGSKTFDMLLKDYIKTPVNAGLVRCGIEFPDDETRKKIGKPITDNDIFHALQKAKEEKLALRFFHIAGYNPRLDWDNYIHRLGQMLERVQYPRILHLMFNNLQYQNYTPLYSERRQINPKNYIDHTTTREWYDYLRQRTKSVLVGAPSPFQHVAARMGVELAREKRQVDFWLKVAGNPKKLSIRGAYNALVDSRILDTPALKLNISTGKIAIKDE